MTDNQTFKLTGPAGEVIMTGSMSAILERLPDTHARNDALSTMLDTAVKQVEAEEKLEEAKACAVKILADGITRLTHRLDQFEKARDLSAKRAEAERKAQDQRRVQRMMDELPDPDNPSDPDEPEEFYSIDPNERAQRDQAVEGLPPPKDPAGAELETDDGDLEIKHAPAEETDDLGLEGTPTSTRQTLDLPEQRQVPQPVSASFW
jgi:hypothetical protein